MDIQLSEASGVPFYRQLVEQIGRKIRSGQLVPGDRLPSVRELAAELLVSLITVRRAYSELEAERLIVRRQGQGTYVSEDAKKMSREQVRAAGRSLFSATIEEAKGLGLSREEMEKIFEECLVVVDEKGEEDGRVD